MAALREFCSRSNMEDNHNLRELCFRSNMGDNNLNDKKDKVAQAAATFDPTKKKKKKKAIAIEESSTSTDDSSMNSSALEKTKTGEADYEYEELLDRLLMKLRDDNPKLADGEKCGLVLSPPQVLREGSKKTVLVNFMEYCRTMVRQPDHVMSFMLAELGTSGSLDGQLRLVVKGRFSPKNFGAILRKYANQYVICFACKRPDTRLSKENRLNYLRCERCCASRSVAPIEAGFLAKVGKRNSAA
ncbi:putative translation initiation factor 2, beta subunit [Rosa chinensis]|uniref:Eukaryotic translation initiation factor 2 subunit beta n=1 Tax=Rosa chinensis TaxID=74649 RepID=A0A2P6SNP6_ROSCH|nr:eukaryotic translation initiation factor 2 subunit beta [Rosa chinensis]PRQ60316.1 putative translation initiation factor 2, beta subunit [Rosa chinensis]